MRRREPRLGLREHHGIAVVLLGILSCASPPPPDETEQPLRSVAELIRHGDYQTALEELRTAPETPYSLRDRAMVLAMLGRFDAVQDMLAQVAANQPVDSTLRASIAIIRARVSLGLGETEPATLHARRALDLLSGQSDEGDAIRVEALVILCRANVSAGRVGPGRTFCREAQQAASVADDLRLTTLGLLAEAEAHFAADDPASAVTLAEEAVRNATALRHAAYQWRALRVAARAYERDGNEGLRIDRDIQSLSALAALREQWGPEVVTTYLQRVDLAPLLP